MCVCVHVYIYVCVSMSVCVRIYIQAYSIEKTKKIKFFWMSSMKINMYGVAQLFALHPEMQKN